jgi:hypothetical protein
MEKIVKEDKMADHEFKPPAEWMVKVAKILAKKFGWLLYETNYKFALETIQHHAPEPLSEANSYAIELDREYHPIMARVDWPDPTQEMLAHPEFEAIWQVIKTWDINVPYVYQGYMGATGNHVRAILDALYSIRSNSERRS